MLALAEAAGRAGRGIDRLPARRARSAASTPTDEDYLIQLSAVSGLPVIIQGLGGRNKIDAPTATWEAAQSFLDRATEAGAPVYSMLIARPFDRPVVIDETNFHYLAVPSWDRMLKLPHDERVRCCAIPQRARELRDAVEHYNRDPARARRCRRRCGTRCSSTRSRGPSTRSTSRARSSRSPTSAASRRPTRCSTSRSPRISRPSSAGGPRARSGRQAVGEAQRDARMMIGVSDGGAHLARDDGADWSSYFLRSWVLDRERVDARGGHPPDHAGAGGAASGSPTGARSGPARRADLLVFDPETIGPWKKEFVHDLPGGVGRFKAWGKGVQATIVNGVPIVLRRRARPVACPARWCGRR